MSPLPSLRNDLALYAKANGPIAGQLELTSSCFQKCRGCDSWREDQAQKSAMSLDSAQNIFWQLARIEGFEHFTLTGGDPQQWPSFDILLHWFKRKFGTSPPFRLQLNTALARDGSDYSIWRDVLSCVKVSIDSTNEGTYRYLRNDKGTSVAEVVNRAKELNHPSLSINCTFYPRKKWDDDAYETLLELEGLARLKILNIRKVHVMAGIGDRSEVSEVFWKQWSKFLVKVRNNITDVQTSCMENPQLVREALSNGVFDDIPCHAGKITFHIKSNGDVYPCCLVGGEALPTFTDLRIGNVWQTGLARLLELYQPKKHYCNSAMPCRDICQWKQLGLNRVIESGRQTYLTMP